MLFYCQDKISIFNILLFIYFGGGEQVRALVGELRPLVPVWHIQERKRKGAQACVVKAGFPPQLAQAWVAELRADPWPLSAPSLLIPPPHAHELTHLGALSQPLVSPPIQTTWQ